MHFLAACVWKQNCVPCHHFPINHLSDRGVRIGVCSCYMPETDEENGGTHRFSCVLFPPHVIIYLMFTCVKNPAELSFV